MADYWVSRDKYFCKYCKIYIADDKPSRQQHETGFRHKGNYERYIRDIYKRGMRDEKDRKEELKEINRIEAAAKAAMGIEEGGGGEGTEEPVASTSKTPAPATVSSKPTDPYANYTTAASLGYRDDRAEREKEEKLLREKEGTIGQWERVVKPKKIPPPPTAVVPTGGLLPIGTESLVKREEGKIDLKPELSRRDTSSVAVEEEVKEEQQEKPKRKGYFTEKGFDFDEDFDPTKITNGGGGIKLKRKRLTLKEERELEERAKAVEREREEKVREQIERDERYGRGAGGSSGWRQAEIVEEEPMLDFDSLEPPKVEEGEDGVEGKVAAVKNEEAEEEKPNVTGGAKTGFKKRKMHGAGTTRKK